MRRFFCVLFFLSASALVSFPASAQAPIKIGDAVVSSSLRSRMYSWDWFGDAPGGEYTYSGSLLRFGLTETKKTFDWQVEFAVPALVNMPTTAVMPAPFGQLGLGGSYSAANSGSTTSSSIFLKQGNVKLKGLGGIAGQSLKVGRMEFIDGAEMTPGHSTLAALKRDRIAQRLLANFGFTDVQRSLDGAQYVLDTPKLNVTAVAGPPDRRRLSGRWLGRAEDQRRLRRRHGTTRQVCRDRLACVCARLPRLPQRRRENR